MIRFVTDLLDGSTWGLAGRLYLGELSGFTRYQLDPWPTTKADENARWFEDELDRDACELFRGRSRGPYYPSAVIYHGTVVRLLAAKEVFTPVDGAAIALTTWNRPKIPKAFARGLKRFTSVWVPSEEVLDVFRRAGLDNAEVVPIPVGLLGRVELKDPGLKVLLMVGAAESIKAQAMHVLRDLPPESGYGLHLATDDLSIKQDLRQERGLPLSVSRPPRTLAGWVDLVRFSAGVVRPSVGLVDSLLAQLADHCGCLVISTDEGWVGKLDALEASPPQDTADDPDRTKLTLQRALETAVARGMGRQGERPSLAVVIPTKNVDRVALERVLATVRAQLRDGDDLILSDQGSGHVHMKELSFLARVYKASIVHSAPPKPTGWSRARACNAGGRAALELKARSVLFLDADVILPRGGLERLRACLEEPEQPEHRPGIITFMVHDMKEGDQLEKGYPVFPADLALRPATGNMLVTTELFETMRGYDESFQGYGAEDTDFIGRARAAGAVWRRDYSVVAAHQYHPPSPYKGSDWEKENETRAMSAVQGEPREVNPDGWGEKITRPGP